MTEKLTFGDPASIQKRNAARYDVHLYHEMDTPELMRRAKHLIPEVTTGPWVAAVDSDGSNWQVADLGCGPDDHQHSVTTYYVQASEYDGLPRADAEFIALCRELVPRLLKAEP